MTRILVYHDCTEDYTLRGSPALRAAVPPYKTLFGTGANKGLPIGNLNSQFFANVYLNRLDQFVKHELKCRYYLRYCDDFVLLANDPETLRCWQTRIEAFLHDELALELNPKQRLAPVSNGIDFLGYIVRRDYLLVRRRVVNNLKTRLRAYEARLVGERHGTRCYRFNTRLLDELATMLSSYLGHFKLANSQRLIESLWQRFDFLTQYFIFEPVRWRLERLYKVPAGLNTVRRQYRYFRWRFPRDALLFRVGRFYECYDIGSPPWLTEFGLKRVRWNRRGICYGFPVCQLNAYLDALLSRGNSVLLTSEQASHSGGVCIRRPLWRIVPVTG